MTSRSIPPTSTFTIHHDRCDPEGWTAKDIMAFADFIRTGNMEYATRLERLGVDLVVSEHHVPKGGELQEIGWSCQLDGAIYTEIEEAVEACGDKDVTPMSRVYMGKIEYIARVPFADGPPPDNSFSHNEYEIFSTVAKAEERMREAYGPD